MKKKSTALSQYLKWHMIPRKMSMSYVPYCLCLKLLQPEAYPIISPSLTSISIPTPRPNSQLKTSSVHGLSRSLEDD